MILLNHAISYNCDDRKLDFVRYSNDFKSNKFIDSHKISLLHLFKILYYLR